MRHSVFSLPYLHYDSERVWRLLLLTLFAACFLTRFLVHQNLEQHPVGRLDAWQGTTPWFYRNLAVEVVRQENYLLTGVNIPMTRELAALAPLAEWREFSRNRLPRASYIVYLAALSLAQTGAIALATLAAMTAGSLSAVFAAIAGARLFRSRGAGLAAAVLVMSLQAGAVASVIIGPWIWDTVVLGALLAFTLRLRDDPANQWNWLAFGLSLGLGIWTRTMFFWGAPLFVAGLIAWRIRPNLAQGFLLLAPFTILTLALVMRNISVQGSETPLVGHPGWEFARTVHPQAVEGPALPESGLIFRAAEGRFAKGVQLTIETGDHRRALQPVLTRKLRETLGARDRIGEFNLRYLQRRSEALRLLTLPPDATVGLAWAGVLFLILFRRMPGIFPPIFAIVLTHTLLFETSGMERLPLHYLGVIAAGGALVSAAQSLRRGLGPAALFLALYAGSLWLLAVDDHSRGSRYRMNEFIYATREFARMGEEERAIMERNDYYEIQRMERIINNFWVTQ